MKLWVFSLIQVDFGHVKQHDLPWSALRNGRGCLLQAAGLQVAAAPRERRQRGQKRATVRCATSSCGFSAGGGLRVEGLREPFFF